MIHFAIVVYDALAIWTYIEICKAVKTSGVGKWCLIRIWPSLVYFRELNLDITSLRNYPLGFIGGFAGRCSLEPLIHSFKIKRWFSCRL